MPSHQSLQKSPITSEKAVGRFVARPIKFKVIQFDDVNSKVTQVACHCQAPVTKNTLGCWLAGLPMGLTCFLVETLVYDVRSTENE